MTENKIQKGQMQVLWWCKKTGSNLPVVGKGATQHFWSDRHAYFVESVSADCKDVVLLRAKAERVDDNGMSDMQTYTFKRHPRMDPIRLRFRYGQYYKATPTQDGPTEFVKFNGIMFGYMSEFHDYTF